MKARLLCRQCRKDDWAMRVVQTLVATMLLVALINDGLVTSAESQGSIDDQINECRRMAQQEYNDSVALFDASATKDKQEFDEWSEKTRKLLEPLKNEHPPLGQFGDASVFNTIARSPAQVAAAISADVDATLKAVEQSLKVVEKKRQATPRDPALYCEYILVFNHRGALQHLSRYAAIHQLLLKEIERHFQMRILAASTISKSAYNKDRAEINKTLVDLYAQEQQSSDRTKNVLKQMRKQ